MTYLGKVQKGVVVFEGPAPQDGVEVRVDVIDEERELEAMREGLRKLSGIVKGPPDLASNHDYYAHGTPPQ